MREHPRIAVLDRLPLDAGDLDWTPFRELGDLTLYDDTAPEQLLDRVRDSHVVFTNKVKLPGAVLDISPDLQLIGVLATGYDIVDLQAARRNGMMVCNVPAYSRNFTAQTSIALLLELAHHVGEHDQAVRLGQWSECGAFSFWNYAQIELAGKTMLIVGLGSIGRRVAAIAQALGMNVVAAQLPGRHSDPAEFPRLDLIAALPQADVISLHCPLTPETREIVNAATIELMKPTVLIVNTARGPLVEENAMAEALHAGRIGGYATDVLSEEPPLPENPLLHAPRSIITPHLSWASYECRKKIFDVSLENLKAWQMGQPRNVIR